MSPTLRKPSGDELRALKSEVDRLRSFMIGLAGKDPEGNYRPDFVERMLQATQERPVGEFTSSRSFLTALK